jgi:hypothetical protein
MNFGGSAGTPVQTSTTTSSPWAGVQPYLGLMYSGASALQQAGGPIPYQGPTQAPLDPTITNALFGSGGMPASIQNVANVQASGAPGTYSSNLQQAQDAATQIATTQGLTPQVKAALAGLGTAAGQYGDIYSQAQGATNPYLQASIDAQNRRGNEAIQSSMSAAGRYGSGQYQDVMARAQAEVADPLLMQDYEARQARALQATQGLGQTYGQEAGILQQGIGQGLQATGMIPALGQAQYLPAEMALAGGQYMQDYNQQVLQGQIQQYNALQMQPWNALQMEAGILQGAGSLGGTQVTAQTPLQASLASRLAGGALVGAGLGSAVPGLGTGLGAAGGALAGAFL